MARVPVGGRDKRMTYSEPRDRGTGYNFFGQRRINPLEILSREKLRGVVGEALVNSLRELGVGLEDEEVLLKRIWSLAARLDLGVVEKELRRALRRVIEPAKVKDALDRRAGLIARQVEPFILGDSVCDVGCGDGLVAYFFSEKPAKVLLVDIQDYRDARVEFPFFLSSAGAPIPFAEAVDTSLILTVLHHAQDPLRLLQAVRQITKRRAIVIESVVGVRREQPVNESLLCQLSYCDQFGYASFFDWLYNRVMHEDVVVPYNYRAPQEWRRIFEANGFGVSEIVDLGIDQAIVPEHHVLYVLDPIEV